MNTPRLPAAATTPLSHSALVVTITDLVAEYELRHTFRNDGPAAIEAIYSFPVPLDSAFMGMEATLAGEHLVAQIQPRAQASRDYDDAIADGNSAVLLERLEPGMLCVNLGNLKPGEAGEIVLRFAAPLRCAGGTARFSLPLVHRPRYGRSRLDELAEPRHDFAVEHPLEAVINVRGLLGHAPVSCATHAARFASDENGQQLRLNQAMLDRDVVLIFDLPADFHGQGRLVRDGDAAIGMVSFNVPTSNSKPHPCDLCLVMDGSGSMTGDAIVQSRAALTAVAGLLGDQDRIQVLRFGSSTVPLFRRPLKASTRVRHALGELSNTIASDLGGTEIGDALRSAINALTSLDAASERNQAIVLVTDGAVQPHEIEAAQTRARESGIRIFVVAVGSSAGADVLEPLATDTAGILERAVPAEPIDEVVTRQLRRAREAAPVAITIDWGCAEARPLPIHPAYAGDAVTAIAMLPADHAFDVTVEVGDTVTTQRFHLEHAEDAPALRALAGHSAWQHAVADAKAALALRYGLVTDETSAILVKVRADGEKVEGLPIVVPVAHMLPEGMVAHSHAPSIDVMSMSMRLNSAASQVADYLDVPAFLRRNGDDSTHVAERRLMQPRRKRTIQEAPTPVTVDPAALDGLVRALVHLLLEDSADGVTIEQVLSRINPAWRDQVAAYLAEKCPQGVDRRSTTSLLKRLLAHAPDVVLSDDQEAVFAIVSQRLGRME